MTRVLFQSPATVRTSLRCGRLIGALLVTALLSLPISTAQRGPDVMIIAEVGKMVYEFRQNVDLRMIRVVPSSVTPHCLIPQDPTRGDGDLLRSDALVPS